jgi:hypothetical protein
MNDGDDELAALVDYRVVFDRSLAGIRAATDTDIPGLVGAVKAREEISQALNKAEGDYWRAWEQRRKA